MASGTANSWTKTFQLEGRSPGGRWSTGHGAKEGRRWAEKTEAART